MKFICIHFFSSSITRILTVVGLKASVERLSPSPWLSLGHATIYYFCLNLKDSASDAPPQKFRYSDPILKTATGYLSSAKLLLIGL